MSNHMTDEFSVLASDVRLSILGDLFDALRDGYRCHELYRSRSATSNSRYHVTEFTGTFIDSKRRKVPFFIPDATTLGGALDIVGRTLDAHCASVNPSGKTPTISDTLAAACHETPKAYDKLVDAGFLEMSEFSDVDVHNLIVNLFAAVSVSTDDTWVAFTLPDGKQVREPRRLAQNETVLEFLKRLIKATSRGVPDAAVDGPKGSTMWDRLVRVVRAAFACGLISRRVEGNPEDDYRELTAAMQESTIERLELAVAIYKLKAAIRLQGGSVEDADAGSDLMRTKATTEILACKDAVLGASKGGWRRIVTDAAVG